MRELIKLTDEEIEAKFEPDIGCTVDDLTFTLDTFEDFKSSQQQWNIPGRLSIGREDRRNGGMKDMDKMRIECCQVTAGQPRRDVIVVDFGVCRAVSISTASR